MAPCHLSPSLLFFFFQAEDGIRDHCVTGVQTCALPISPHLSRSAHAAPPPLEPSSGAPAADIQDRSEERRVGKSVDLGGRRSIKKKRKIGRQSEVKEYAA